MMEIDLWITMEPQPKQRPRVKRNGHAYTPVETVRAERMIRHEVMHAYPALLPSKRDIGMCLDFYLPNYKRMDWDNLGKLVSDALNGVAYVDDSQILECVVRKHYPDAKVQGLRGMRDRKSGDPLTYDGEPHNKGVRIFAYDMGDAGE